MSLFNIDFKNFLQFIIFIISMELSRKFLKIYISITGHFAKNGEVTQIYIYFYFSKASHVTNIVLL